MMFNKKEKKEIPYCYTCGCLLHFVSKRIYVRSDIEDRFRCSTREYCEKCQPSYSEIGVKPVYYIYKHTGNGSIEKPYCSEQIEVTKEGKPVKK